MLDYLSLLLEARVSKRAERGASAVEYALLIAGIAGIIVLIVYAFGGMLTDIFSSTCQDVGTHANAANSC